MKRVLLMSVLAICGLCQILARDPQKFSPEKFQSDMEQYIAQEACLTAEEATQFFPLLREMHKKQRDVYDQMKKECSIKPVDAKECKKVVQKRDLYELELKNIQQTYHNKFFTVLSPSKVYDVIKAEDRFHRKAFKSWSKGGKNSEHPMKRK